MTLPTKMTQQAEVRQSHDAVTATLSGLSIYVTFDSKLVRFCLALAAWRTRRRTRRSESGKTRLQ